MLGGEGLVTYVTGPREVYIQTKNPQEFVNWLWKYIGPRVHSASRRGSTGIGLGRDSENGLIDAIGRGETAIVSK